jgi:hypothetical protein
MNMYVFEDVLWDYTSGMVVIAAEDLVEAQAIAFKEFNYRKENTLADFLEQQAGFKEARGEHPLAAGFNQVGILHAVYGGG